jgi:small-conductance mechanosensitive channel
MTSRTSGVRSRVERNLRAELLEKAKLALDEAGIEIPYPQRVIHAAAPEATASR